MTYVLLEVPDQNVAEQKMKPLMKPFQNIAGITDTAVYEKEHLTETVTVDYQKLDWKAAATIPGFFAEGTKDEILSREYMEKALKKQGFQKISPAKKTNP